MKAIHQLEAFCHDLTDLGRMHGVRIIVRSGHMHLEALPEQAGGYVIGPDGDELKWDSRGPAIVKDFAASPPTGGAAGTGG